MARDPVEALDRIAFLLERSLAPTYRVRTAARVLPELGEDAVPERAAAGKPETPRRRRPEDRADGVGGTGRGGAGCLRKREDEAAGTPADREGPALRALLRGDCHLRSDWSDGGGPIEEMGRTAARLGHEWAAPTDHSPRLTAARGHPAGRLREQLDVVAEPNGTRAPFRLLTGIECDVLDDGSPGQEPESLDRLDVVVVSVHSGLRLDARAMTRRMVAAVREPHSDVLGHRAGRLVSGRGRPGSRFDADEVFAARAETGTAVEIDSRPERLDPPRRLPRRAVEAGALFSADTDAHAPGRPDRQVLGCARAEEGDVPPERVVTTWALDGLPAWTRERRRPPAWRAAEVVPVRFLGRRKDRVWNGLPCSTSTALWSTPTTCT